MVSRVSPSHHTGPLAIRLIALLTLLAGLVSQSSPANVDGTIREVYNGCVRKGVHPMNTVNVREAREQISRLLDAVAAGEEFVIVRRGHPAARLVGLNTGTVCFPDRQELRDALPPMNESAADAVRDLRDQERF